MVVMIVRKYNPKKEYVGLSKAVPAHKLTIPLPDDIVSMSQFAEFIESRWGSGRYYISGDSKHGKHKGFYTIFLGMIKDGKAIGRGKIAFYVDKNKERLSNHN